MTHATGFTLRGAEPRDTDAIVQLIRELADFEQLSHLLQVTPEKLEPQLFGDRPAAEAIVAELTGVNIDGVGDIGVGGDVGGAIVGFALFFTSFSTFLARPGLYLEDLYVMPAHRGAGIGKALLTRLGALAVERQCGRFEWSVLDWNDDAIRFYEKMGATVMPEWHSCRVAGEALQRFDPARSAR